MGIIIQHWWSWRCFNDEDDGMRLRQDNKGSGVVIEDEFKVVCLSLYGTVTTMRILKSQYSDNEIKELMKKAFTAEWNVKPCGREVCRDIIHAMELRYPGVDFGRVDFGIMNTDTIRKYAVKDRLM